MPLKLYHVGVKGKHLLLATTKAKQNALFFPSKVVNDIFLGTELQFI